MSRSSDATANGVPTKLHTHFTAHKGPVHVARFNTTGRYALTGGADRKVHLFNAISALRDDGGGDYDGRVTLGSSHRPIKSYEAHSGAVLTLSIASDNATFASAGEDRNVILWDVGSGQTIRRFSAHAGAVNVVMYCGSEASPNDVLAVAGFDCVMRFYDLRARGAWKPIMECKEAKDAILCADWNRTTFWTGSVDGVVRTYDIRAGNVREDTIDRPITSIMHSAYGKTVLATALAQDTGSTSSNKDSASLHAVLDMQDGSHLQSIRGGPNTKYRCRSTFFSSDSKIVAGDEAGRIAVWDVLEGRQEQAWQCVQTKASAVLWTECSPRKDRIVTASADGTVNIWSDQ